MIRTRRAMANLLVAAGVLATSGCYQGFTNTVNNQPPTGNGTDFVVNSTIAVQDTTIIADPERPSRAAISFTMVNNSEVADSLESVSTMPATRVTQEGPIEVKSGAAVRVGGPNATTIEISGLTVPPGSYATVIFKFRDAGSVSEQIAVVPAVGYYAPYGP